MRQDLAQLLAGGALVEARARRASAWWQEINPHSRPLTISDTDIEARVPMLRMYCRWIGETLRKAANDRSLAFRR